jgi:AmmeMemoRadiSam system protein B
VSDGSEVRDVSGDARNGHESDNARQTQRVRPSAVAGTWYPGTAASLINAVDRLLAGPAEHTVERPGDLTALIAPHAGLRYSGPVAACAYRLMRQCAVDLVVLVGPSHFVGFEGVAAYRSGSFETPMGLVRVDEDAAAALMRSTAIVREHDVAHTREHSLEMQLPFLQRVAPGVPMLPLVMGFQTDATVRALADGLAATLAGRRSLLIASSDLSHYHPADEAVRLDRVVLDLVSQLDADGLQEALDANPEHACGGGPMVAVMRTAKQLGATGATLLQYADSGDISGDKSSVVGYMAAAIGRFPS